MADQNQADNNPKISKFLHEYRKQLSLLKIKSFYANHLCKRNCLAGKLNSSFEPCFNSCDEWLKGFYHIKKDKAPEQAQQALYEVETKFSTVHNNDDVDYQKAYARSKFELTKYLDLLDNQLNRKITQETETTK